MPNFTYFGVRQHPLLKFYLLNRIKHQSKEMSFYKHNKNVCKGSRRILRIYQWLLALSFP